MPSESVRSKCPTPGNAGQTITQSVPSASATGPILPSGVESKVEHYLKTNCWHPCFCNHFSAASDCATASEAGTEHDFSATTPASTEAAHQDQKYRYIAPCAYPCLASVFARSLEPVKSSPIQPRSITRLPVRSGRHRQTSPTGFAPHSIRPPPPHQDREQYQLAHRWRHPRPESTQHFQALHLVN